MLNNDFYIKLGQNIKKYRSLLSISQQELADRTNLSLNFIGKIEVAFSKPSLESLIKIAEALEITVSELCDFNN